MARYQMSDGTVVDTENASQSWAEDTRWDGHNHVSLATGSQWEHETLYRSRKGRYYVERTSQWEGVAPHAEWISLERAAAWLLVNQTARCRFEKAPELPDDLKEIAEKVTE